MFTFLLILAVASFIVGSALDIYSSIGKRELNPLFQGKGDIYLPGKNVVFTAIIFAGVLAVYLHMDMPVLMLMFVVIGVPRALLAVRNFGNPKVIR